MGLPSVFQFTLLVSETPVCPDPILGRVWNSTHPTQWTEGPEEKGIGILSVEVDGMFRK